MASLYRRGQYWWVKKKVGGKWVRESTKCTLKRDAEIVLHAANAQEINTRHHKHIKNVDEPIVSLLDRFRDKSVPESKRKGKNKTKTSIRREQVIVDHFKFWLVTQNVETVTQISKQHIMDYVDVCEDTYKPNTSTKHLRIVKRFFDWCIENHIVNYNPAQYVKTTPPDRNARPYYFSVDQLNAIFDAAKEPYESMFRIMAYTGLRIQELLNTRWYYVNLNDGKLTVPVMPGNKSKIEGTIPLNQKALKVFEKLLVTRQSHNDYVFTNGNGNPYKQSKVYDYWVRLKKRLELKNGSLHTFRHSFASHLINSGKIPIWDLAKLMRHKDLRDTMIYTHEDTEALALSSNKLCDIGF